MATKRPAKPRRTLLQEGADPATDPERLRQLAGHKNEAVQRAAWRNPAVPEDVWHEALLCNKPEAWANPMAPFYVLDWTPYADDLRTLETGAQLATSVLWKEPERCSPEGKALLAAKIQEWWATSGESDVMMFYLRWWAEAKGKDSAEHREVVRILVHCVRTARNLTAEDRQALDLLEAWALSGEDRRNEASRLVFSVPVGDAVRFSLDLWYSSWQGIFVILMGVGKKDYLEQAEHKRMMADIIRQARPLPPVAD